MISGSSPSKFTGIENIKILIFLFHFLYLSFNEVIFILFGI